MNEIIVILAILAFLVGGYLLVAKVIAPRYREGSGTKPSGSGGIKRR